MRFWKTLFNELKNNNACILMYVVESIGSSPGRQGFKMAVSSSGLLIGSIGGGFMEHKWVEFCKKKLLEKDFQPFIKRQIHHKDAKENQSGLICSGEQTIAFYKFDSQDKNLVNTIIESINSTKFGSIIMDQNCFSYAVDMNPNKKYELKNLDYKFNWSLTENLGHFNNLYIAGGGHVGLALTKIAMQLGFKIFTFDNRKGLNTVEDNPFATHSYVADYSKLNELIPSGTNNYVVLMSFGYITDKIILKSLLLNNYKYLGMMGSKEKVKQLFEELKEEGISETALNRVHSPIGLPINSQTPEEIAISILAEIIKVKNYS